VGGSICPSGRGSIPGITTDRNDGNNTRSRRAARYRNAEAVREWDTDKNVKPAVEAELKKRGLNIRTTEGSFHVQDPDGFEVQMGGKDR